MRLKGATIPDSIVERVIARRGAEHCFADLDPARTALVVIDLQHAFMNEASDMRSARPRATSCRGQPPRRGRARDRRRRLLGPDDP